MARTYFFATRDDLLLVIGFVEAKRQLQYTRAGMLEGPEPKVWHSGANLPKLGTATADQAVACDSYLILNEDSPINVVTIRMNNGMDRFDVEQLSNPNSVIFSPGGRWVDGSFIAGSVTSMSNSPASQSLMRIMRSAIKKHFAQVRAFWVGPDALAALRSGKRLAYAIQSPPEYDLREESR